MPEAHDKGQIRGKVAVVIGGSGGIGRETCRQLAAEGASIVIGYRSGVDAAQALAVELPTPSVALQVSIAESASIERFRSKAIERFGRADILINTAGVTQPVPHGDLHALTDELIDEVFINNWRGVFATIRAFEPDLRATGDGVIVNVSSIAAFTAVGSNIAYCGAKAGLDIMSRALARILGPEVRVMVVSPGVVDTTFVPGRDAAFIVKAAAVTPLQKVVSPADVAEAIMSCVTQLRLSTGTRIVVDGGRHL